MKQDFAERLIDKAQHPFAKIKDGYFPNHPLFQNLKERKASKVFLSRALQYIELAGAWHHRENFETIETFCLFIGHPRSGHSVIGSLLDAHPQMVVAHELDCLDSIEKGVSRRRLFYQLLLRSRRFARQGAAWSGYSAMVPSQYKGEFTTLQVIGDKKGWNTTSRLRRSPELLSELRRTVKMPIKVIHVKRHPLDNISTMARKNVDGDLNTAVDQYFRDCETVRTTRERVQTTEGIDWLDLVQEQFIYETKSSLRALCEFLGVSAPADYVSDCADVVFDEPNQSREKVAYQPRHLDRIREEMSTFPSLSHYSLD